MFNLIKEKRNLKRKAKEKRKRDVVCIGERRKNIWIASAIIWNIASIILSIASFAFSILAIVFECYLCSGKIIVSVFVALAAIFSFAIIIINFKQQAPRYRMAFTQLYSALLDYYCDPENTQKKVAITDAIKIGEDIIDGTYDFVEKEHTPCRKRN